MELSKNDIEKEGEFPIRPYSLKELAAIYKCSRKSFYTWLRCFEEKIGPRMGRLYTPKQVRLIVALVGHPPLTIIAGATPFLF